MCWIVVFLSPSRFLSFTSFLLLQQWFCIFRWCFQNMTSGSSHHHSGARMTSKERKGGGWLLRNFKASEAYTTPVHHYGHHEHDMESIWYRFYWCVQTYPARAKWYIGWNWISFGQLKWTKQKSDRMGESLMGMRWIYVIHVCSSSEYYSPLKREKFNAEQKIILHIRY